MKKRRSHGCPRVESLEDRIAPGYTLGGLIGMALASVGLPVVDIGVLDGGSAAAEVAPELPAKTPDFAPTESISIVPDSPPSLTDTILLAMAAKADAVEGGGTPAPAVASSPPVAAPAPASGEGAVVALDVSVPDDGGGGSAPVSETPLPQPQAVSAASAGAGAAAAPSGGGGSTTPAAAAVAAPVVAAGAPAAPDPVAAATAAADPTSNVILTSSNGFYPGSPLIVNNGGVAPAPVSAKSLVKAAATTSSGLANAGTRAYNVSAPDPGTPGPYATTRLDYEYGYSYLTLPGFTNSAGTPYPVELDGEVTYPTDLSGGAHPVVMILHGRHGVSYDPTTNVTDPLSTPGAWPPAPGHLSIPSFQGYRFVADQLASEGYIVISIGANGINAQDNNTADLGMKARAELVETQLNLWNTFNTTGGAPFSDPNLFVGQLDMQNIGLMGHSRGGEGVVEAYDYNDSLGSPYGIKAVFALAPVDFQRMTDNYVPFAVLLPYADGDVSDLQGMHFFDDQRYNVPGDLTPKYEYLVMGADHDLFNTVWTPGLFPAGAADDWSGPLSGTGLPTSARQADPYAGIVAGNQRLSPAQQQGVETAYMSAFYNVYLKGQTQYQPILTGDALPPASALGSDVYATYQAPDGSASRLDVNRLTSQANLSVNTLGGNVVESGLSPYVLAGGGTTTADLPLPGEAGARQPSSVSSARAPNVPGITQLMIGWNDPSAYYENDLPAGDGNVSGYADLQFRVAVNFDDYRNSFATQDFSVQLTDASGHSFVTQVSPWTDWLFYPPGKVSPLPKLILQGVRIPLSAFVGVDLTNIQSVTFKFDVRPQGALAFTDIQFADPANSTTAAA